MIHTVFLTIHAATATIALLSGVLAAVTGRLIGLHLVTTAAMTGTLAVSLWVGRTDNPLPLQIVFLGLLALAGYLTVRAVEAWRTRPDARRRPGPACVAALGFNCIGLVTGMCAIGALRLQWGVWTIVAVSTAVPLVGRTIVGRAVRLATGEPGRVGA